MKRIVVYDDLHSQLEQRGKQRATDANASCRSTSEGREQQGQPQTNRARRNGRSTSSKPFREVFKAFSGFLDASDRSFPGPIRGPRFARDSTSVSCLMWSCNACVPRARDIVMKLHCMTTALCFLQLGKAPHRAVKGNGGSFSNSSPRQRSAVRLSHIATTVLRSITALIHVYCFLPD